MNFSYEGADRSKIINKYIREGNNYTIEYLNGDISSFYSTDENQEQKIIKTMVRQIVERQDRMDINDIVFKRDLCAQLCLASSILMPALVLREKEGLLLLPIAGLIAGLNLCSDHNAKINELKKYKLFLEMTRDNEKRSINDSVLDCIEPDKLYQIPLNLNTIDDYSYRDVKLLYKKMKQKK